jgi:hypothetical protein
MFNGGFWATFGKALVAIILVGFLVGTAVNLVGKPEIQAWSHTIRGLVDGAGNGAGGGGQTGANLPTGAR